MYILLYTDKTIAQCISAVNERLRAGSRSGLEGWTDRSGEFTLTVSTRVARRFTRKTRLQARLERESGVTVVEGYVPHGVGREGQVVIFGALAVVGFILLAGGNALLALLAVAAGAALYIPLSGDHKNSVVLMRELRSTLKAKDTPPSKKSAQARTVGPTGSSTGSRPGTASTRRAPASATRKPPQPPGRSTRPPSR